MSAATRLDESKVDITPKDIEKALRRPPDFGYNGEREGMFETWSMGPVIQHRDSGILDKSNALALKRYLKKDPSLADDWEIASASHWAVGWVEHISFRVVDPDGSPSRIFRVITAWFNALSDYPVADDSLYSEMEMEASWKWISEEGLHIARRHDYILPDDWQDKVMNWWDANDSRALENGGEDQGASPSEKQYLAAFEGCGFKKEE